jgi:hypothetical protein
MALATFTAGDTNYEIATYLTSAVSAQDAVTATASGTITTTPVITGSFVNVTTVATAGDSVRLPVAAAGVWVVIRNSSATSMNVFPNSTSEAINGGTAGAALAHGAGKGAVYFATAANKWSQVLGA